MAGVQKVFLRVVALVGDGPDDDEMPDRVPVTGRGSFVPTMAAGTGDVTQGPDALQEIRLVEPIDFEIVNGMLTYGGEPFVWLPVPTGQWQWRATFEPLRFGEQIRTLDDFVFPLDAATEQQIADPSYPGINLALYGVSSWEPGTVNLTAEAIQQITIMLGRASNAAITAEGHADRAESTIGYLDSQAERAETARTGAEASETAAKASETAAKTSETAAKTSETAAKTSETNAKSSETNAKSSETAAKTSETNAQTARTGAETARTGAETARTGAEGARDAAAGSASAAAGSAGDAAGSASEATGSASAAAGSAQDASSSAQAAASSASTASAGAQIVTDNLPAIEAAPGHAADAQAARAGAESARDAAAGSASDAAGSATAAARSASDADESKVQAQAARSSAETARDLAADHRQVASAASTTAQNARGQAQTAEYIASGHASDAAGSAAAAGDERVVAQDAAVLAEGHAQAADGHRVDAEAAAALAQSLRWVVKGAWSPGQYEAGDVVVYDERAYYAQTATSVEPPAQPWVPLTPASGGASHWDDLDGKPVVFPPEAHTHDAEDVSGAATPLLDVTEASVGAQSVGEALDATTDASRLEGALTDQVDISSALVDYQSILTGEIGKAYAWNAPALAVGEMYEFLEPEIAAKADADHTHDGADITGALTDQVDASAAVINYVHPGEGVPDSMTVEALAESTAAALGVAIDLYGMIWDKSDVGHTHDGADISGALTDAVDVSNAEVEFPDPIDGQPITAQLSAILRIHQSVVGSFADFSDAVEQALDGKADISHTHDGADITGALTSDVDASQTLVTYQYWDPDTEEVGSETIPLGPAISSALSYGTSLQWLADELETVADRVNAAPATWHWDGTTLPTAASQVHAQARVGDFIVAPNLATDPGWHRITGV